MAALARLQRQEPINNEDLEQTRQQLTQSWKAFTLAEVSQPLVETAGRWQPLEYEGSGFNGLVWRPDRERLTHPPQEPDHPGE